MKYNYTPVAVDDGLISPLVKFQDESNLLYLQNLIGYPKCTEIVNLVEFSQAVYKMCSQKLFRTQTHGQPTRKHDTSCSGGRVQRWMCCICWHRAQTEWLVRSSSSSSTLRQTDRQTDRQCVRVVRSFPPNIVNV